MDISFPRYGEFSSTILLKTYSIVHILLLVLKPIIQRLGPFMVSQSSIASWSCIYILISHQYLLDDAVLLLCLPVPRLFSTQSILWVTLCTEFFFLIWLIKFFIFRIISVWLFFSHFMSLVDSVFISCSDSFISFFHLFYLLWVVWT